MSSKFPFGASLTSQGTIHQAWTPSDDVDLPQDAKTFYVGTGGDIAMMDWAGNVEVWPNIPDGSMPPFIPKRIMATDTTASDIIVVS